MIKEIQKLQRRIDRLETLLRRETRPHQYQDKRHTLIVKNPADVKIADLGDRESILVKNKTDGRFYQMFRAGGDIRFVEMPNVRNLTIPTAVAGNFAFFDALGELIDSEIAAVDVHTRLHDMDDVLDHNSPGGTENNLVDFDAAGFAQGDSGLSVTNTSDAITKKHTQDTDTVLTTNGTTKLIETGTLKNNLAVDAGKTIDGRDVSVDGTKLDGIDTGAKDDQTGAEIKSAYEGEADTNAYTDAEKSKLGGVEASADVTDSVNVQGALETLFGGLDIVCHEDQVICHNNEVVYV